MKKHNRFLSAILVLALTFCSTVPLLEHGIPESQCHAAADAITADGFGYSLSENNEATITDYTGEKTEIDIPSEIDGYPVTGIGKEAFLGNTALTSVTIPDSVKSIGDSAFFMSNLSSVAIGNGVVSIGASAFARAESLSSIVIPSGVTCIEARTFQDCTSLTSVTLPDSLTTIEACAFTGCSRLKAIAIPNSVTSIESAVFWDCVALTSITLPKGLTKINTSAFDYCINLKSVTIPDSVTSIADYAFRSCNNLTDIYYSGSEKQWTEIAVLANGNDSLNSATIHFDFGKTLIEPYSSGDPNGDGVIDSGDALAILNVVAEVDVMPAAEQFTAYDVDTDSRISSYDAYLILMYEAEIITEFPKA